MRIAAAILVVAAVLAAAVMVIKLMQNPATPNAVQIEMTSNPFPSSVGDDTFLISLVRSDGTLVSDASVQMDATMMMDGMLPLQGRPQKSSDGQYPVDIIWPMMGQWTVHVNATLPDQSTVQDSFDLFVYPVPPMAFSGETSYRSASAIQAEASADPAHEYVIDIPQGTQALQRSGQGEDLIPAQIHLSLTGQNILVIRNDDIADQTVGPFYVRAGETIRQVFTRAAVFQGKCTIRHGAEVSIVVD